MIAMKATRISRISVHGNQEVLTPVGGAGNRPRRGSSIVLPKSDESPDHSTQVEDDPESSNRTSFLVW